MTLEKLLILNDDFLELSLQTKMFSQGMLKSIMKNESPSVAVALDFYVVSRMHLLNLLIY